MNRRTLIRGLLVAPAAAAAALPVFRPRSRPVGELVAHLEIDDRMTPALEAAAEAAHKAAAGLQRTADAAGELSRQRAAAIADGMLEAYREPRPPHYIVIDELDEETLARLEAEVEEYSRGLRRTITTHPVSVSYRVEGPRGLEGAGDVDLDVIIDGRQVGEVAVELVPTGVSGPFDR